ncbi:hypothetical protein ACFQE1_16430 [Halobium palmae]|uniref:Uncharacterized protein n=1 Tax=Halobium palmae TaxID=1776492 RepID=A0ABD5S4F4_9EURY
MSEHTTACDCTVSVDAADGTDGTVRVELPVRTVVDCALSRFWTGTVGVDRCCPRFPGVGCC